MPQQLGKFDFSNIPAADFAGIPKAGQGLNDPTRKPASTEDFLPQQGSAIQKLAALFPMIGGAAGGILGGPTGAALGGAAGGGYQQLAQHASELPGAAMDVARNLMAQPGATLSGLAGGAAGGAKDAAIEGGTQAALEYGGGLAMKGLSKGANALMRGYLKPSLAEKSIKDARTIVQTALDEGLSVSKAGEERSGRLIKEINKQVNGILDKTNGKVDLKQVADRVRSFAKAKYFKPGVDDADYQAALEVADSIDSHASLTLPNGAQVTKVRASAANDIKQSVRPNSRAYGQQGAKPEAATRKVAGSEMRQAVEGVAKAEGFGDQVGTLNAREQRIIDAEEAVRKAAGREENKGLNPTAVPNLIAGALGAEESYRRDPVTGITMALATRAALSPAVATRAAIMASKIAKQVPGMVPANAARLAIAYVTGQSPSPEQ